jgi:hypothetical protein
MNTIGVEHHALLFAWIAREAVERFGVDGEKAVLAGVRSYGEQRGRRMALRAQADGRSNGLVSYLVYGELDFKQTENQFDRVRTNPYLEVQAVRCSWYNTWKRRGLLDYGRLYCREIDRAVMRGFNPGFRFEVAGNLTEGAPYCRFLYYGEGLGITNTLRYILWKRRVGSRAVKPWDYHLGHLYKALTDTLTDMLGSAGQQAAASALAVFAGEYGEEVLSIINWSLTIGNKEARHEG